MNGSGGQSRVHRGRTGQGSGGQAGAGCPSLPRVKGCRVQLGGVWCVHVRACAVFQGANHGIKEGSSLQRSWAGADIVG